MNASKNKEKSFRVEKRSFRDVLNYLHVFNSKRFNKTYNDHHDPFKKETWLSNVEKIQRHNEEAAKGLHSYFLKDNNLADLTHQIYLQKMVKLTKSRHRKIDSDIVGDFYHQYHHIPDEVNWIDKGFVTPTYNQKDCGSCYAFSIAGVLQGQIFKQTNKLVPLSAQQLVDCSVSSGNYGCAGGSLRNTLHYLEKSGGLMAYSDYPYVSAQKKCRFNKHMAIVNTTSWAVLPARDERALEVAVANIGPIAVSINAAPHTFQFYHKGIYDDPGCNSFSVNHAMLVVGYTKDVWILKNWWGKHWGEQGYMRLKRHKNRCGVANYAAYALV
ncbi:cathepsin K isoform X2 [Euwallacea fornicatus]|uniref:cathepsin K isoform X2 n=1 Tax=Euwallacea fornicatus TaxID=995702 RepID=UPI00338F97F6